MGTPEDDEARTPRRAPPNELRVERMASPGPCIIHGGTSSSVAPARGPVRFSSGVGGAEAVRRPGAARHAPLTCPVGLGAPPGAATPTTEHLRPVDGLHLVYPPWCARNRATARLELRGEPLDGREQFLVCREWVAGHQARLAALPVLEVPKVAIGERGLHAPVGRGAIEVEPFGQRSGSHL